MAGRLRYREIAWRLGRCIRSRCGVGPRYNVDANPPAFRGHRPRLVNQWAFRHSALSLLSNASIKLLSVGFARLREAQNDIVGIGLEIEILGDELTAVVDPDRPGRAGVGTDAFQGLNDVFFVVGEAGIVCQTEPRLEVDNGQDAELLAHNELVMEEIHRPDIVRADGFFAVLAQLCFDLPLGVLIAEMKPQLVVDPASLLNVHLLNLPAQQHMHCR